MNLPTWMLLGFTLWTILALCFTVGVYRWNRILTGRARPHEFRADQVQGAQWYQRAMRAHANCVENLPVFAALVFVLHAAEVTSPAVDAMAVAVLVARICQTVTHVGFVQTDPVVVMRFVFFFAQLVCFVGIAAVAIRHAIA